MRMAAAEEPEGPTRSSTKRRPHDDVGPMKGDHHSSANMIVSTGAVAGGPPALLTFVSSYKISIFHPTSLR